MFQEPYTNKITIYSKSGCPNCIKVKDFLKLKKVIFEIVSCDDYLLDHKEEFIQFISEKANKVCTSFPIVFDGNKYIGGLNETKIHIEKVLDFGLDF